MYLNGPPHVGHVLAAVPGGGGGAGPDGARWNLSAPIMGAFSPSNIEARKPPIG